MRWTMTKKRKISFYCLFLLLSALFIFSGFMVYRGLSGRQKEKEDFEKLARLAHTKLPEGNSTDEPKTAGEGEEPEPAHRHNLMSLFEQNSDCVGWLCIPGAGIDYPIMHTPKDMQKYLHKNFYGKYSQSGVPFLDGRCSISSDNLIIYGHNMRNGTMFGSLRKYTDKAYLKEHPVIEFETKAGCARYKVFAVVTVNKQDAWYSFINASNQEKYEEQIEAIRNRALHCMELIPEYNQQLLTLSTCYGSGGDKRLLVVAVRVQKY